MNIFWISPTPSHPTSAGNRAHIKAMGEKFLTNGHTVTFCFYGQENVSQKDLDDMREFWSDFIYIKHNHHNRKMRFDKHWGIDDWFNKDLQAISQIMNDSKQFDMVYCEYVFMSKCLDFFDSNVVKVLSCHDRMSDRAELLIKNNIKPDFFYTTPEEEKKALYRADIVLGIQETESEYFRTLTNRLVLEVCSPIEKKELNKKNNSLGKLRVGYLGSNNSLNRKSLSDFFDVHDDYVNIEFHLAGSICNGVNGNSSIIKHGFVKNEGDFYDQVDVVINPMIDGTGLKIKSLSALSYGVPFLATKSASVGIKSTYGIHNFNSIKGLSLYLKELALNESREDSLLSLSSKSNEIIKNYINEVNEQFLNLQTECIKQKNRKRLPNDTNECKDKKILLVTDVQYWEAGYGSHSRIESLINHLSKKHQVDIFFFGSIWPERLCKIKKSTPNVNIFSYKAYEVYAENIGHKLNITFKKNKSMAHKFHSGFTNSFNLFLNFKPKYDVVMIEYIWLAYLIEALPYKPITILDSHDIMSIREYKFIQNGLKPSVSISMKDELEIMSNFDSVIAIQEEEYFILREHAKKTIPICAPHVVNTNKKSKHIQKRVNDNFNITFIGANSEANYHGIKWFIDTIWPKVYTEKTQLNVIGNVCKRFQGISFENIIFHGLIENLNSIYDISDITINPMFFGGGLKIKTVESLSHGVPVLCTQEGCTGLSAKMENGIVLCNNENDFISHIKTLMNNQNLNNELSFNATNYIENNFSSAHCFKDIDAFIGFS